LVLDYDALVTQAHSAKDAADTLKARGPRYEQKLVESLAQVVGAPLTVGEIREVPLRDVHLGMTLLNDVRTEKGVLLVSNGFEVSASFLERLRNFAPAMLNTPVKVTIRAPKPA
jgi:hypothetical protein